MVNPETFLPSKIVGIAGLLGTMKYHWDSLKLTALAGRIVQLPGSEAISAPSNNVPRVKYHVREFTESETNQLVENSQSLGTTVGNMIAAALAIAAARVSAPNAHVLVHRCINLRGNFSPTVRF
jgi:hypothetical protein